MWAARRSCWLRRGGFWDYLVDARAIFAAYIHTDYIFEVCRYLHNMWPYQGIKHSWECLRLLLRVPTRRSMNLEIFMQTT